MLSQGTAYIRKFEQLRFTLVKQEWRASQHFTCAEARYPHSPCIMSIYAHASDHSCTHPTLLMPYPHETYNGILLNFASMSSWTFDQHRLCGSIKTIGLYHSMAVLADNTVPHRPSSTGAQRCELCDQSMPTYASLNRCVPCYGHTIQNRPLLVRSGKSNWIGLN